MYHTSQDFQPFTLGAVSFSLTITLLSLFSFTFSCRFETAACPQPLGLNPQPRPMSRDHHPIVTPWLQRINSELSLCTSNLPADGNSPRSEPNDGYTEFQLAGSVPSSIFNSTHRSTYDLLKSLPLPSRMLKVLPDLPTYHLSSAQLIAKLPDRVSNPLVR